MAKQATECDWNEIERRVKAGESYRSIAQDQPISHVSIMNRSKKEGWKVGKEVLSAVKVASDALTDQHSNSKLTPGTLEDLMSYLSQGMSLKTAASKIGVHHNTVYSWKQDESVAKGIEMARLASLGDAERSLYDAHERGDWKAALARLQRAPETREDWQDESQGSGGITVVVNVERGPGDNAIDVTPEPA